MGMVVFWFGEGCCRIIPRRIMMGFGCGWGWDVGYLFVSSREIVKS